MKNILAVALLLISFSMNAQTENDDLNELIDWMTGSFSSADQAAKDENYYDIDLHMTPIWEGIDEEGVYLYVEQAAAESPNKPYRQRVYYIHEVDLDTYASEVYLIPNEEKYIGAWKLKDPLSDITFTDLTQKVGCTVYLEYDGFASFAGKTDGKRCQSTLRGASYATSEVAVMEGKIKSWDQGFDDLDSQVWGATAGGYLFIKE
ncbi:MAG: chromophore lyase CpcT/CpeT [Bacteroidota bacterium]